MYSLVATCKLNRIEPFAYLRKSYADFGAFAKDMGLQKK